MKKEEFEKAVVAPFQDVYLTVRLAKEIGKLSDDEIADAMKKAEEIAKNRVDDLDEEAYPACMAVLGEKTKVGIALLHQVRDGELQAEVQADEEVDERRLS